MTEHNLNGEKLGNVDVERRGCSSTLVTNSKQKRTKVTERTQWDMQHMWREIDS